jgi:hypothetical protein
VVRQSSGGQEGRPSHRVGIEKAKAAGVYKGRRVKLDHAKHLRMRKDGMGATEIAKANMSDAQISALVAYLGRD